MTLSTLEQAHLLGRRSFDIQALMQAHPPRLSHANKKLVFELCCPKGSRHEGTLVAARYSAMPLPQELPPTEPERVMREDVYGYEPVKEGEAPRVEWYVNFADINLFVAHGTQAFAQDEMQVAEHPALGAMKEALKAEGGPALAPRTRDGVSPTPFLIRGAPRRCSIATDPDPFEYRTFGLYGNRFATALPIAIQKAVTVLHPPTLTNLIAMEALPCGSGAYARGQIKDLLVTATTSFQAAMIESSYASRGAPVVVHTGHWGAGAYGGNRRLVAIVQTLAARMAGIATLVYHTFDAEGSEAWREAMQILDKEIAPKGSARSVEQVVDALEGKRFAWGVSDGN